MKPSKIGLSLFIAHATGLLAVQTAWSQTEKLGIVQYTPPKGWKKTRKPNVVAFSKFDQAMNKYCILTVYGATPGAGSPQKDFAREWNKLVVEPLAAEADPKTDVQKGDGWTATSAGSAVESEVGKAAGFLTVISGFGRTVSILAVFNDPAYTKQVGAFIDAIEMDKVAAPTKTAAANPPTQGGNLVIPKPTRQLTIADLVGEWEENSGLISTHYVYRDSGSHAGTDRLAYRNKMKIDKNGKYTNDFFEVRNGKGLRDITTGKVTIIGRLLTIKEKGTTKYVIRGWLKLPDMTILKVVGPWGNDQKIPENIFTNPKQGENLATIWVRKK